MTSYRGRLAWIAGVVTAVVVVLLISGRAQEELAPEPRRALVAIEVAGSGVARTGRVEIEAGTPFSLHAVLEAENWRGATVYYCEAAALEVDGRPAPSAAIRHYGGPLEARVLWFTVEGSSPYRELTGARDEVTLEFREIFRPDWPRTWTVPGSVRPSSAERREGGDLGKGPQFGTQRYHVRIELLGPESRIVPRRRLRSAGAGELPSQEALFPTVVSRLEGPLARPSRLFGLSQIEPGPGAAAALRQRLVDWSRRELAFSRAALLSGYLDGLGATWDTLDWRPVEPGVAAWGRQGDLIRAGARVVIAYLDRGTPGILDYEDLAFDFERGAAVSKLGEVFVGEGLVERARPLD